MGAHTKIIDLFGTPACGKSTLAIYIKENSEIKVGIKKDIVKESKQIFCYKYLLSFRLKEILSCAKYHFAIPKHKRRKGSPLYNFILNYNYYNFISNYSNYDAVVIDNSLVQSIISHQNAADLLGNPNFKERVKEILSSPENTIYVWCDIMPEVSLERMEYRGRYKGRIDLQTDRDNKLKALNEEREQCRQYYNLLKQIGAKVVVLDCNKSTNEIAEEFFRKIKL